MKRTQQNGKVMNLISVNKIDKNGFRISFGDCSVQIIDKSGHVIVTGKIIGKLYQMKLRVVKHVNVNNAEKMRSILFDINDSVISVRKSCSN